jgi:hypothetical protein
VVRVDASVGDERNESRDTRENRVLSIIVQTMRYLLASRLLGLALHTSSKAIQLQVHLSLEPLWSEIAVSDAVSVVSQLWHLHAQ